ncbi:MAG TPA: hypothetical protein PLF61_01925, partial [Candidatus Goldiibacteriota bacterium]|nr:hypothetical protein [Candidatus Goldiibacteriota bacterium]
FFLIPFLFFTFLGNKKNRYIMPLLPFIAIIISYLLCILRQDIYKKLLLSAIIVFSLVNYVYSTYSLPVKWKHSNRPISENWHVKDFLDKIETDKNVTLAIVPDHPHMNNALYSFYAKNFKNNVKIMGIYNFPMGTDYFLIKTGDLGPFFSGLEKRKQILEKIQDPLSDVSMIYEKIFETELPDGSTGSLYKIKSNIKINKKTFESEIYSNINYLLNRYLKNAESLKITVQGESNAGNNLMNKIIIECKRGFAGDFKHKDAGLYLNNVQMEIDGILINPYALRSNSLEIIHLDKITVKSLEINGEDLKNFAGYYVKGIENLNFNFENNLINISASYKKIPLFVSVYLYNPNPYKDNSDVCFKLKKIRIGFIPIPTSFINFLLKDYNPLLVKSNPFFKVNFGEIKTEGNKLCIR